MRCPFFVVTSTMVELVSLVAQVYELSFFFQLYCILIKTKKSESSFLELSDFFLQGTHIEPVVTHFEPPYLSPWLTCSSYQGNQALSLQTVDPDHLPAFYQGGQTILKAPFLEHGYNTNREASLILPSWLDNKLFRPL